jgi:glycosyltransferase involved in cell wall biosynthesis
VLYVIDQIRQLGGAERTLMEIVRRLPADRFRCSIVTFQIDARLEALKRLACPLYVLPLRRTYDLNAVAMGFRLRRLIRQKEVSIVHTFFESSDLWAAPIAKLSGCPIVISSRRDMGILRRRKHDLVYPIVNNIFDKVLAVSDAVRSYCVNHDHLRPERVETLWNGIDLGEFEVSNLASSDARKHIGLSSGAPVVSTVANIRYVKGIDVLLRAAARVCREFPEAIFLVVGGVSEPEIYAELRKMVELLQLGDNVRFLGGLSNSYQVLRASDVFCLPSRSEGFSNALVEAMACELPCVATRVGGNGEALTDSVSGFLIPSEDDETMANRILCLLRDPKTARTMGKSARETVEQRFSMTTMMSRLVNVYEAQLTSKNV